MRSIQLSKNMTLCLLTIFAFLNVLSAQCPVNDPTASNSCIFNSGSTSLNASGSTGFYNWFYDATGDSLIGTGASYQTPFLTTSQTFYVAAIDTNTALQFDGYNDYIALNKFYNTSGAIPTLTVEAWVNTSVGGLSDQYGNWAIVDFDRSEYYNLFVRGNTGEVGFSTYAGSGGIDDFYSGVTVNDGNWHHIVGVYDGTDKIIYVDGVEVALKSNPHNGVALGSGSTRYGIIGDGSEASGYNGNRNNRHYDGLIDEVRIWDDVRSPQEILDFRDTCLIGSEANLRAYFNFNEDGGNTITDLSGNGADGTLFNLDVSSCWVTGALVSCDCQSNLVPADVTIASNLKDTILTCSSPSIVLDAGSSASNYNWSTGATSQTITVNQNGFYEVTTSGGTCNGSSRVVVDGFTHAEKALLFDGGNDYAAIEDIRYEGTDYRELTVEVWLKTVNQGDQIIASFDRSEYWRMEINGSGGGNGRIGFDLLTSSGIIDFGSNTRVDDGEWHHVACVYNNGSLEIFIDGVLDATTNYGATFGSGLVRYGFLGTGSEAASYNGSIGPNQYFDGELDEFRIWERALDQTEIRENMAKHRSGKTAGLQLYYKFDNISNDTIFDHNTEVTYNALMNNFGAGAEVISAAPIGDESTYVYNSSWGGVTQSINSCDGETYTLSDMSGTPTGVHLYYVNNFPNDVSGLGGSGTYDRYFGVHKIGDPTATYTATYNYTGNPYVNTSNESTVELYRRPDNATFPWINTFGNLNTAANTIEAGGQNTEFIIDYDSSPLPVELITYEGAYTREYHYTTLSWSTASEMNCDYYVLEKSTDGFNFELLDTVAGNGTVNLETNYQLIDSDPARGINYYKLTQYDFNGLSQELGVISVMTNQEESVVYPNPIEQGAALHIELNAEAQQTVSIQLKSSGGKMVEQLSVQINVGMNTFMIPTTSSLSKGVYFLTIEGKETSERHKLVVY
mgnify:CR=1 FL=1